MKKISCLRVLPAVLLSSAAAAATPCLVSGSADLLTQPPVARHGTEVISLGDCIELEVLKGSARVFLRKPSGQGYYVDVAPGERLVDKLTESSSSSFFTRFRAMARTLAEGNVSVHAGMKRDISNDRVEGFPYAKVMAWKTPVVFNFLGTLAAIDSFELSDGEGKRLYRVEGLKGAFSVPGELLQAGKDYQWQATVGGAPLKGRFHALDALVSAELQAELGDIERDSALQVSEKKALTAMTFDRHGLAFDRDRTLTEVNGQAPPRK